MNECYVIMNRLLCKTCYEHIIRTSDCVTGNNFEPINSTVIRLVNNDGYIL